MCLEQPLYCFAGMVDMQGLQFMFLGALLSLFLCGADQTPQSPIKECKTRWFNRDSPSGTGDYELLTHLLDANPNAICPEPIAIEVQTVDGVPASNTGQTFFVNAATQGFACINTQQRKGELCHDYRVRFTCPPSFCSPTPTLQATSRSVTILPPAQSKPEQTTSAESQKGVPSSQAPVSPKTTSPPAQTPQPKPEETTSAESQKGAPTPQAQVRPETTFSPAQTPQPEAEETTNQKGAPTPQAQVRPETTFPPAQTPQPEPEETTSQKGVPSPQAPVRPETTFPPAQTPQPEPEETTSQKGAPTPQAPVGPETTFPPAQTPQSEPEEATCAEDQKGGPTPQAQVRPETTSPPARTPQPEPQETTSAETQKGVPSPQASVRPETTLPPAQTPQPGPEETTSADSQKGGLGSEDLLCGAPPTPESPPSSSLSPQEVCKTRWFDEDDPLGTGDLELLANIEDKHPDAICSRPMAIEVQTLDGTPASETGQRFFVNNAVVGFFCINTMQGKGQRCRDYRVRFTCPPSFCSGTKEQTTPGLECVTFPASTLPVEQVQSSPHTPVKGGQDQTTATPEPVTSLAPTPTLEQVQSTSQTTVRVCKTIWFDRDNATGTGDYELLTDIMDTYPDSVCFNPIAIEVQTLDGTPASETGQKFALNEASRGFVCINQQQSKGTSCLDYKVRFTCLGSFCGKGQSEVDSTSIAPVPTIRISPRNPTQGQDQARQKPATISSTDSGPVRTTLQKPVPVCKTKWINRDNPNETGDFELIYYIRKSDPNAICKKPIAIEVQTVDGIPAEQTGQKFTRNDVVHGFACINADQKKGVSCHDYKVRFTCTGFFCTGGDQKGSDKKGSP